MKIFLSWSGSRSHEVARAFGEFLSTLIQSIDPWISSDIEKGSRWNPSIADALEKSSLGIFCLTKDNLDSNWLHFEAGAIAKRSSDLVCTFLLDISPADVRQPLSQFQNTRFDKSDVFSLMKGLRKRVEENGLTAPSPESLEKLFEMLWPELEAKLQSIVETATEEPPAQARSSDDLLAEVLATVRRLEQNLNSSNHGALTGSRSLWDFYQSMMRESGEGGKVAPIAQPTVTTNLGIRTLGALLKNEKILADLEMERAERGSGTSEDE